MFYNGYTMTFRSYISTITAGTIFGAIGFGYILFKINPYSTDTVGFVSFYVSVLLTTIGISVLLNLLARYTFVRDGNAVLYDAPVAFRQSLITGCLVVTLLLLRASGYFAWWSALCVVLFFGGLEFLIGSWSKDHHENYV